MKFPVFLKSKRRKAWWLMLYKNGDFVEVGENVNSCVLYALFGNRRFNEGLGISDQQWAIQVRRLIDVNKEITQEEFEKKMNKWDEMVKSHGNGYMLDKYHDGESMMGGKREEFDYGLEPEENAISEGGELWPDETV